MESVAEPMTLSRRTTEIEPAAIRSPLVSLKEVSRSFGAVRAVSGVSLNISPGECIGLVGHNGAGKSTLMNILLGVQSPDSGVLLIDGGNRTSGYDVPAGFRAGIRCVFQELSLAANLNGYENLRLQQRAIRGLGWRRRARHLLRAKLDQIFPGNTIDVAAPVGELPVGERQMVEIARAFVDAERPARLVILDEPTSSLDLAAATALTAHIRRSVTAGLACIFISHRLKEVIQSADRVIVMRDGEIVADAPSAELTHTRLVELMSGKDHEAFSGDVDARDGLGGQVCLSVTRRMGASRGLVVREREIVGLAGLDGHGQRSLLHRIYFRAPLQHEFFDRPARLAYVTGDRQREGIFALWSVGDNLTAGLLRMLARWGVLSPKKERSVAEHWRRHLGIRSPSIDVPIQALSGGNQQKVLIARAFASDAPLILLDDPTRGVDITTKRNLYEQVRGEAAKGRAFLWYTTELEELAICDRIYVFYQGAISAELARGEISEDRIIRASFTALGRTDG